MTSPRVSAISADPPQTEHYPVKLPQKGSYMRMWPRNNSRTKWNVA